MAAPALDTLVSHLDTRLADGDPPPAKGDWNLSETLQHCAQTIHYSVTGYPELGPVLVRRLVGPVAKRLFLRRGAVRHDVEAPLAGAPPLDPQLPVAEALAGLRKAVDEFGGYDGEPAEHPAYGRCSRAEYAQLHAMHIVDHVPGAAG